VSRLSTKCVSLDVSHPYGPPWLVTGIALPHFIWLVNSNLNCALLYNILSTCDWSGVHESSVDVAVASLNAAVEMPWRRQFLVAASATPNFLLGFLMHHDITLLSSLARKPGSWVRIPHKAWIFCMCMCLFCLCCPVFRQRPCDELITPPRSPTVCKNDHETEKFRGQGPGGCRASEK
jgi:hypothetical protein